MRLTDTFFLTCKSQIINCQSRVILNVCLLLKIWLPCLILFICFSVYLFLRIVYTFFSVVDKISLSLFKPSLDHQWLFPKKQSSGSMCFFIETGIRFFGFWLWRTAGAFPQHLICLSQKPSHRETKPPSNASLLSLDLSLATCLPLLSWWQHLTRHDVQLERMAAFTLLLQDASVWCGCVLASRGGKPRALCFRCVLSLLSSLLT